MDKLNAWTFSGELIGILSFDPTLGRLDFDYTETWIGKNGSYPLSPNLPFDLSIMPEIKSAVVARYFNNLLPEGNGLEDIARMGNLSKSNLFGLLRLVGKESSSAMMLLPSDQPFPHGDTAAALRPLPLSEVSERIRSRDAIPFAVWDRKVRLSVAGYQDKIGVFVKGDELFLAEHPLASTHILKPMPIDQRFTELVANEHFCMLLSAAAKLTTAKTRILRVPEPALLVERFDRIVLAGGTYVDRLHVIDGCQALDLPPTYKNERNFGTSPDVKHIRDGVSFKKLFDLNALFSGPALFRLELLRWALMQYLIGNTDAHGKNITFHVRDSGLLRMAPAYDLVCTMLYPDHDEDVAMSIGDEFCFADIGAYQWLEFANECNIPRRVLINEMRRMAKAVTLHAPRLIDRSEFNDHERNELRKIVAFVLTQAEKMKRSAGLIHSDVDDSPGFTS